MINMKKSSVILIVVFLLTIDLFAKNYYVAVTGSDTNAGTSVSLPYASVTKAVSVMIAGDTIFLRGGTYTLNSRINISKSGTSTSKFYMFAYTGDSRPILDFSGMAIGSSNQGVLLSSASYWYIKGIKIKGAGDNGMQINGGGNNIIEFCDFFDNRDAGLQLKNGTVNNRIINCDAYYNADYVSGSTTYTGGNADGFAPKLDIGSGNYFYGCRSWLNSDDGWDGLLYSDCNISTTLVNCWTWKNGYLKDGTTTTSDMNGNGFKMGGGWITDANSVKHYTFRHNMTLNNCLAFENKGKGFDQNHNYGSMVIYNGTAYNNGNYNFYLGDTVAASCSVTLKNNLYYAGSKSYSVSTKNTIVSTTNCWNIRSATAADFVSVDTTGISGPRQDDGSLPVVTFMHLKPTDSFIDAGTNVGLSFNGTAPDLGCFETSPVSAVSNAVENTINIYPNPVNDEFRITNITGLSKMSIFDLNGQILLSQMVYNKEAVSISSFSKGLYIVRIVSDNHLFQTKIVKN